MRTPERTTAAVFPRYAHGEVVADSAELQWPGLFVRRIRFPRVVDQFLVPATPEPLMSCTLAGAAEFRERDLGQDWIDRRLGPGDIFVTHSKTPYELSWRSPAGGELDSILIHIPVDHFLTVFDEIHPGKREVLEVMDFFGRDESLAHLCFACAEMLAERVSGSSGRVTGLVRLLASHLVEKYVESATGRGDVRGGLPIGKLRKVEAMVRERMAEEISVDAMAELAELSPYHFSRVFKQTTGMTPLQFLTRERISRAQQLIRETPHSLIEIAMDVGYSSPSHFAQVFRRMVGVTPTDFRGAL